MSPSRLSVSFAWKEPLNARGESSVVVYLHNLWGSKNAKKLISRPRHRPSPSLRLPASSLVYTCSIPHSSPFITSTTSSFTRVCPRPFRLGLPRSLGALSQLFPEVHINFYFVCGVRNLFRVLSLSFSLFDFFSPPSIASSPCCNFIMSWQEVCINSDIVSLSARLPTSLNTFVYSW